MSTAHERHRQRSLIRSRLESQAGRDIGPLPPCANSQRRASCERSLEAFCRTYLNRVFVLPWAQMHRDVIAILEGVIFNGGYRAVAMPRGSGKTSLCLAAALWAVLYHHQDYALLVGSQTNHARALMDSIVRELEMNDLLAEDFPEACLPVRALERITTRAKAQLSGGRATNIVLTPTRLHLATFADGSIRGGIIEATTLRGRLRGLRHTRADGAVLRPTLAIVDDPQTDESAHSPTQTATRLNLLTQSLPGIAGPNQRVGIVCACTVICTHDLADRLMDRTQHPQWRGVRYKMLEQPPQNEQLWQTYADLYREGCAVGDLSRAHEFYRQNQIEMDRGAVVSWPARVPDGYVSAIEYACALRAVEPTAFIAEYQNEPSDAATEVVLSATDIAGRSTALPRGSVPAEATRVTAGVDVQANVLYYCVCAWNEHGGGVVVDYGAWPRQGSRWFTAARAKPTLKSATRQPDTVAAVVEGLSRLQAEVLHKPYKRLGEGVASLDLTVIDANWHAVTDAVYRWCAAAGQCVPAHGSSGMRQLYHRSAGRRVGHGWALYASGRRGSRYVVFDGSLLKTELAEKLQVPPAANSALTLFHGNHDVFAQHLTAERAIRLSTYGGGERVVWRLRPNHTENHWLDALVMAYVGALILGLSPVRQAAQPARAKPRVRYL